MTGTLMAVFLLLWACVLGVWVVLLIPQFRARRQGGASHFGWHAHACVGMFRPRQGLLLEPGAATGPPPGGR